MAKALRLGAADFLTKPVTRNQLLSSIQAALNSSRKRNVPPAPGSSAPA
jgi:FixJ family two-component response regulator